MDLKNTLLRGTLFLTFAGILSRMMGFFYRIFLANTIGAEGMGIYQLIFPIYSVCYALCASGIETSVSKLTAAKFAVERPGEACSILKAGLFLTLTLSLTCSLLVFHYADFLAEIFLKEPLCAPLLKILALTIPLGTAQSCICGYYFGIHRAGVPSAAQLIEQSFRIGCVFLLYRICIVNRMNVTPALAVIGLAVGEFCSLLFTITCFSFRQKISPSVSLLRSLPFLKDILSLAAPLTCSRICINLLASLEAATIPAALRSYGMDSSAALSVYGILNGMALPLILFPNALTGSLSTMLLPAVSESQAGGNLLALRHTINRIFSFCLLMGCGCFLFFFFFGNFLGNFLFSNEHAGDFITVLSWICPFLYLNTTLTSVLNGLGRTGQTFFNGTVSLFIRIGFIFLGIPKWGIHGYLFGLLASQLFVTFSSFFSLHTFLPGTRS